MRELTILKIGGNVIDDPKLLKLVLDSFSSWTEYKILVHGGGKIADILIKKLGIEPVMHEGRRVTDEQTLEIVTMVYAGWINKNIVCDLQFRNCNALGLTGVDGNIIPAVKRPVKEIDFGFVGDIDPFRINAQNIISLLDNLFVPILAPVTHDQKGQLLNTNADTIASSLAIALSRTYKIRLIYCFEKNGILLDPNDELSVINQITEISFQNYKSMGIIHSGMIPKLENAFLALKAGVSEIKICGPADFNSENRIEGTSMIL